MRILMTWLTASLPLLAAAPGLHELDVQGLFEAGKYQEVVQATEGQGTPANLYLAGQSYQKLNQPDNAKSVFQKLASRGETDPWHDVGQSAIYLAAGNLDGGVAAAQAGRQARADATRGALPARVSPWPQEGLHASRGRIRRGWQAPCLIRVRSLSRWVVVLPDEAHRPDGDSL